MRWATLVITLLAACTDVRDYRGTWSGSRVGDAGVLRVGGESAQAVELAIDGIDRHGLTGRLTIEGLVAADTPVESIAGAEADVLAGATFPGNPVRVFLAFAAPLDGAGDALVVIALYDDDRVEVRLMRRGTSPLYAIYALRSR